MRIVPSSLRADTSTEYLIANVGFKQELWLAYVAAMFPHPDYRLTGSKHGVHRPTSTENKSEKTREREQADIAKYQELVDLVNAKVRSARH